MIRAGYLTSAGVVVGALFAATSALAQESQCFVDNQGGNDSASGASETEPVASLSAIPSGCTTVRFARGNVYDGKLNPTQVRGVTTFANYGDPGLPLPMFKVPSTPGSGPVLQSMGGGGTSTGLVFDGLHFAGARGTGAMSDLAGGIGVMLGNNTLFVNNEVSDCDIGMMLSGTGNRVINNYVHDLVMGVDSSPDTDANVVGGAEGIFINNSNNEVAYNAFVRCTGYAQWVDSRGGSSCDGGATEVSVPRNGTVTGLKIHHNLAYATCGFLELATVFSDQLGQLNDCDIYANVSIESQWLVLLQVSNTQFKNVHFFNNTLYRSNGDMFAWFLIADSVMASGQIGGTLDPGEVYATNNLYVMGGAKPNFGSMSMIPEEVEDGGGNLEIWSADAPNLFVNEGGARATDYALGDGSPAIDVGVALAQYTVDFLGNAVPAGAAPDVGAFEFGSTQKVGPSGNTMLVHAGDTPLNPSQFDPASGIYTLTDTATHGFGTGVVFDVNDLPVDGLGGTVTGEGPPESSVGPVGGGIPAGVDVPAGTGGGSSGGGAATGGGTSTPGTGGRGTSNGGASSGGTASTTPDAATGGTSSTPAGGAGATPAGTGGGAPVGPGTGGGSSSPGSTSPEQPVAGGASAGGGSGSVTETGTGAATPAGQSKDPGDMKVAASDTETAGGGGCGCRMAGAPKPGAALLAGLLGLGLFGRRRRH